MLERLSPAVKEYLVCCVPVANILAHKKLNTHLFVTADEVMSSGGISEALNEKAAVQARFFRSYMLGVATQAALAITSIVLAILLVPVSPVASLVALSSFHFFVLSAGVSLIAYTIQSRLQITVSS